MTRKDPMEMKMDGDERNYIKYYVSQWFLMISRPRDDDQMILSYGNDD